MKVSFVVLAAIACAVFASNPCTDGGEQTACKYDYDSAKKLLTISGNEGIPSYSYYSSAPWAELAVEHVVVESGIKTIGSYAFEPLSGLRDLTVKGNIESFAYNVFADYMQNFTTLLFEGSLDPETLSSSTFSDLRYCLTTLKFASIKEIPYGLFQNFYYLTSVTIGGLNGTIGEDAFTGCGSLESLTLDGINITIGESAFYGAGLEKLVIPSTVYAIEQQAFSNSQIKELYIKAGVKTIGRSAFGSCYSLEKVIFYGEVESLYGEEYEYSSGVFDYCYNLETVYYKGKHNPGSDPVFHYCYDLARVLVDDDYEDYIFCGLETKKVSATLTSAASSNSVALFIVSLVMAVCVLLAH